MSFAINIPSCLCFGGQHCTVLMCPNANTGKALKETTLWRAIFLAAEYSMRGCHNKGNNKRGHVPALHGVSITMNRKKAMSQCTRKTDTCTLKKQRKLICNYNFPCISRKQKFLSCFSYEYRPQYGKKQSWGCPTVTSELLEPQG